MHCIYVYTFWFTKKKKKGTVYELQEYDLSLNIKLMQNAGKYIKKM